MGASATERRGSLRFTVDRDGGGELPLSAILERPADARALLLLAHGAGAGMTHPFLEALAARLGQRRVATLRYQFPFREAGRRRPDAPPLLRAAVRAAAGVAQQAAPDLPLFAGGKSMGGRMTSSTVAEAALPAVCGLVFVGFPLHPAGKPAVARAAHLARVASPMLFLQGTRDALAAMQLVRQVCEGLGERAALHVVEGADHGFTVLKRSGRTAEQVLDELAEVISHWIEGLASGGAGTAGAIVPA